MRREAFAYAHWESAAAEQVSPAGPLEDGSFCFSRSNVSHPHDRTSESGSIC